MVMMVMMVISSLRRPGLWHSPIPANTECRGQGGGAASDRLQGVLPLARTSELANDNADSEAVPYGKRIERHAHAFTLKCISFGVRLLNLKIAFMCCAPPHDPLASPLAPFPPRLDLLLITFIYYLFINFIYIYYKEIIFYKF